MEYSFNNKKEDDFATIFSKIKSGDSQKKQNYSQFQNNLSKLEHSVSLLRYYATKGKMNPKKIKKKFFSLPKSFQTEPNYLTKVSKKLFKNSDFIYEYNNNKNNENKEINLNNITHEGIKESSLTKLTNKKSKKKLFMTNLNYQNLNKSSKTINNTNYNTINTSTKYNADKLPKLDNNINPNTSTLDTSFSKTKIDNGTINLKKMSFNNKRYNTFEKEALPKVANYMIKTVKKENNNIRNTIYKGMEKFSIMDWYMKTRFKYAQYKFGIAEIQKYFLDLKAYGKPEEEEIEKRKTFYEHVEDIIDDIQTVQEQKEYEKVNKKYGVEQDKKKIIKSKKGKKEAGDPQQKQIFELSKALLQISRRHKREKQQRDQIDDILFKCKQGIHSINCLDQKLSQQNWNV